MHLLFADRMPEQTIVDLEARGHTCVMEPGLTADELAGRIAGFDGLVVRSTKVRRAVFEAADRLVLVIRAGAGTNTIDTDAAASRGVFVCNVPGRNAAAVAELTLGLLLAIDRRIADNVADVRDGHWDKKRVQQGRGAAGVDHGHHRSRLDRLRGRRACGRVRHPGAGARQADGRRPTSAAGRGAGHHHVRLARGAAVHLRHRHPPRPVQRGHQAPGRRGLPRPDEARARSCSTPRGATSSTRRALLAALDAGAVRAGLDVFADEPGRRQGPVGLAARPAPERRRHPPHRRLDRAGAARDRRGRDRDRRRVHGRRGAPLREPRARPARLGHPDGAPPRPGRRARPGPRPAQHRAPQRRAHGEPRLPWRRGGRRLHRRRGRAVRGPARRRCARSRTCWACPR